MPRTEHPHRALLGKVISHGRLPATGEHAYARVVRTDADGGVCVRLPDGSFLDMHVSQVELSLRRYDPR